MRDAIQARSLASKSTRDGARLSVQRILCGTAIQRLTLALESLRGREGLSFRRAWRRTAIQPLGSVWDGLEGATRPSISMRQASMEFAIG